MAKDAAGNWIGYGVGDIGDEVKKINRRLLVAYPKNSKAKELGVVEDTIFTEATRNSLIVLSQFMNTDPGSLDRFAHIGVRTPLRLDGVADLNTRKAIGSYVTAPAAPTKKFIQQGVGFSTDAFLMGDVTHSYVNACDEGSAEFIRLATPDPRPKVVIGYSMGDDVNYQSMMMWPANRRNEILCYVGFGSPTRPEGPTLLGNDPGGKGIAGRFTPDWLRNRAYHFTHDGDMYANAVGLLPTFYQILTRMEFSTDFAVYLFQLLTSSMGPMLLGLVTSTIPFAGSLAPILGMLTPGGFGTGLPTNVGQINLMSMILNIDAIVKTLGALLKFVNTNAHYHYHDQPEPFWRGMTGVDCAAQIIQEVCSKVPGPIVVYDFPGTVSWWNDGPPAWTTWKLP